MSNFFKKPIILPLFIIIAIALIVVKIKTKEPISHSKQAYPSKVVEIIHAKKIPFRTRAIAYGYVEPSTLLKSRSEVAGKISYIHPGLEKGGSLAKGTVVLRIEPTIFEFSLEQSKAGLSASKSTLKQVEEEEKTTQRSLVIAKKNLKVGAKELSRLQSVRLQKLVGQSAVDVEEQKVLQLQQQVEDLQGKLNTYHSRKLSIEAQIKQSKTQLAQSQDTLGRTEVILPFDARIGDVNVEAGEFTGIGNILFEALGTKSVEINAQLASSHFRPLLTAIKNQSINLEGPKALQKALKKMSLETRVSLVSYEDKSAHWQGKLLRISESVDQTRDTIGLVVSVDAPYQDIIPGKRPPLLKGMYAAVEILAPLSLQMILPRNAIHQGRVYIAKPDNTLEIRHVNVAHRQGEIVVIESGIKENEQVIITDVIPVIEHLLIEPKFSVATEKYILKLAIGNANPITGEALK